MSLVMSLRSRGAAASAGRVAQVLARFGATTDAMRRRLDAYDAILAPLDIRPTWPTTACVLARHPDLLRRYRDRGIELAVHGLVHGDHARLDARRQRDTLGRAIEIFRRAGLETTGFRGPYLRYNAATLEVLRSFGFRYHSSQAVSFALQRVPTAARAMRGIALARALYAAHDASAVAVVPRVRDGLVDLPVAIPDDEILVDRLGADAEAAAVQWCAMLGETHRRGELFTIQLHPERIVELGEALRATCLAARALLPRVHVARLDEIASWWLRRSTFRIQVTRRGDRRFRILVDADPDATVLVRDLDVPRVRWYGRDATCCARVLDVVAARVPAVGVSRRTPTAARAFLAAEGFAVEETDRPDAHGAYVDTGAEWSETALLDVIERSPGPLVRIWRWPCGARSALAVTGDIDALTLRDFALRSWETRGWSMEENAS